MIENYDAALADGGEPMEADTYGDAYAGLEKAYYPSDDETPAEYSEAFSDAERYASALPGGDISDEGPPEELTDKGLFDEELSDEELTYRERYEHLQRLMGRQANELGELRRRAEELEGLLDPQDEPPAEIDEEYDSLTEAVQPWADAYYREYLDLGFSEEEAAERAWSKAYAEHSRVTELAGRIADEKYGNLAPLVEVAAGPHVLKQAVDTVYSVTVTTAVPHNLRVGDSVVISECSFSEYDGTWLVAATDAQTFTISHAATGTGTASGAIHYVGGCLPMLDNDDVPPFPLMYRPALAFYAVFWLARLQLRSDPQAQDAGQVAFAAYVDLVRQYLGATAV